VESFEMTGGRALSGTTKVYGSKNAALPILAATVLAEDVCVIDGVPHLEDVRVMMDILQSLGAEVTWEGDRVSVNPRNISSTDVPSDLMRKMRSSIFLMGPLLARFGDVRVSRPGGCVIGQRPIDYHLRGMRTLGASVEEAHGYVRCTANRLYGDHVTLDFPSVGATENLMMAAVLADGITTLENVAREPEIVDLARFLQSCGAQIKNAGEDTIQITGVHHLTGTVHRIISDRIVSGTMMIAAAATCGDVTLENVDLHHLSAVITKMREIGVQVHVDRDIIRVTNSGRGRAADLRTAPFPGFPTDLQAPFMAMLTTLCGTSVVRESVFEARFKHVDELNRMGARITVDAQAAIVRGVPRLSGAVVEASDLRGGAALVIAGLIADGVTRVEGLHHIDRGYEQLDMYLRDLGADIVRRLE